MDSVKDATGRSWFALDVFVEAPAREAIEYGLMEANALGTETTEDGSRVIVRGYFESPPAVESLRPGLLDALRIYDLHPQTLIDLQASEVPDRDWLAEWKKNWQPVEVGRFIIAPPWLVSVAGAVAIGSKDSIGSHDPVATAPGTDTITIKINPGMAFGTGTHETTRLCLKAIEKHYRGGSFLDVGTGTGILAIAAAKMSQATYPKGGLASIIACDVDADAIGIAKENAELNGVTEQINFRVGSVDDQTESADVVSANLTAPVIVELLPALIGATCGRLILSGILDSQIEMVKSRVLELGVTDLEIDQDGEWVALTI
jgi:ribosomal protein L11 methyltransferase